MSTSLETKLNAILNEKETKILPENIKAGVQIFDVTGTYEGSSSTVEGIKQFSTVEEMQADTTAKEGDLAVVYGSKIQSATANSQFQTATFPDTVVLDTALTDYVEVRYRAVDSSVGFDCMGQLDNSMFIMECYTETGSVRIQYESSDGITYTRTDTTGNPVDFGTEIYYEMTEMWNDAIGKFIQVGGNVFEGLYEYKNSSWKIAISQLTATSEDIYEMTAYSNYGVIKGTLQNKDNLTQSQIMKRVNIWNEFNSGIVCPEDMSNMFRDCTNLTTIPLLDTSNVKNMQYMFRDCTNLTTIPLLNTSNVGDMLDMFYNCRSLSTIPLLDTSNVTSAYDMFYNCTSLTIIPQLDTSRLIYTQYMFKGCTNLTTIPLLNTSNVVNSYGMFENCTSLTSIPQLDISNAENIYDMFYGCTSLSTIPILNISKATTISNMFKNCTSLSDESLNNILAMCINATAFTGTKTLAYIGLTSEQATKCTTLSNYSAFTAAGWTTGY